MSSYIKIQKIICLLCLWSVSTLLIGQNQISLAADQFSGSVGTNAEVLVDDDLTTYFFAGWNQNNYPGYAYIDLGGSYDLTRIDLYDFAGIDDLEIYSGSPGNWSALPILTDPLMDYEKWKTHLVTTTTTHLRVKIGSTQARISEIRVYGTLDGDITPPIVDTTVVVDDPPVVSGAEVLCEVAGSTLINGMGDPGDLVDEQELVGDLLNGPGGAPTNRWFAGWNMSNYPAEGYLDLGAERELTRIFLRDINGQGNFKVYTGAPGNWSNTPIIDDNLEGYLSWTEHTTAVYTRYLKIEMQDPDSRVAELAVYGYCDETDPPVGEDDTVSPNGITDLSSGDVNQNDIQIHWTASGDDGDMGQATYYELRYSTAPITVANFENGMLFNLGTPNNAGSFETGWLNGLNCGTTYYIAMRVFDESGNASRLSNIITVTTDDCGGDRSIVLNLNQPVSNTIDVDKAKLKYNKDFAYSLTLDDGGMWHYYTVYQMLNGGLSGNYPNASQWVVFPNDPVIPEAGFSYSDGCGNQVKFKAGLALNTHRIFDFVNQYYMTWADLEVLRDADWDIISHGHSHCNDGCDYENEVWTNKTILEDRLGVDPTQFVIPSGNENYYPAAYDNGMLGVYTDNINLPGFAGLRVDTTMNFNEFKMHRYSLESILPPYGLYLNIVADKAVDGSNYWINEFAHNIGHKHQGQYFIDVGYYEFKEYMNYLQNTFGQENSAQTVWMAPVQEVYEYLNVRDNVEVDASLNNNQLTIYLDDTNVPDRLRRHALSLNINLPPGVNIQSVVPNNINIESYNATTGLLNINW